MKPPRKIVSIPSDLAMPNMVLNAKGDPHPAIAAIKALSSGQAREDQQKIALEFLIEKICCTYDLSYRQGEGGDRDTSYAEGRRSVGLIVRRIIMQPIDMLLGLPREP